MVQSKVTTASPVQSEVTKPQRLARLKLFGILMVCAAPVLLSYYTYYMVRPEGRTNYGALLAPPVDAAKLKLTDDGNATTLASLKGKWLMVSAGPSSCDTQCVERLYLVRQVRATTGKEMERIERVWLVTDGGAPSKEVLEAYAGMKMLRVNAADMKAVLPVEPGADVTAHIYVVDPLSNVILRFPAAPDPSKMKKDMSKLLRASRIG
jgi:hypothetical protein